jgi:tape measure domain-containing protein
MAFEQSGIQLVVKNFRGFIGAIGRVNKAQDNLGKTADRAAKRVSTMGARVDAAHRKVQRAHGASRRASISYRNALRQQENRLIKLSRVEKRYQILQSKGISEGKVYEGVMEDLTIATNDYETAVDNVLGAMEGLHQTSDNLAQAKVEEAAAMEAAAGATAEATAATAAGISASTALSVALGGLGIALAVAAVGWKIFTKAVNIAARAVKAVVTGAINLLMKALNGLKGVLSALISPFSSFIKNVLTLTTGLGLYGFLNRVSNMFRDLTDTMTDTLSLFQRLDIQFESLAARDIAIEQGISMGKAFRFASQRAEELLSWTKRIAVTTPFSVENLTQTLAMANAMGLNIDQSKRLTTATGNFVAAMGLQEEHMFRIIYNFGQMLSQGKLNGREFRDLANSFVPVWRMMERMGEQAGMTAQEFKDLAFEGAVPVTAFFEEFIRMANEDFPGAMEKMARTWAGVTNNIKDFIDVVIGVEIFGPTFNRFTELAASGLEKLLIPSVRQSSHLIGENFLFSIQQVTPAIDGLFESIRRLAEAFGFISPSVSSFNDAILVAAMGARRAIDFIRQKIDELTAWVSNNWAVMVERMKIWGHNMVASLASGMASAIGLITKVINTINRLLSYWLAPGSPPKAFPKLPEWGMGAMRSWLEGFTQVDFDVLKGIQSPLKQALDILTETGRVTDAGAGGIYRDISKAIAKALSGGQVDESLFRNIANRVKVFGGDIAELAQRYVEWAEATNAVRVAEEALEAAQKRETRLRVDISKQVREYNKALRAGADRAALRTRLAELNVTEEAARQATGQRKEAETQLELAQEYLEVMQEQVKLQEELVSQLLDITKQLIIPIDVDKGALGGLADSLEDLFDVPMPDIEPLDPEAWTRGVKKAEEEFEKQWEWLRKGEATATLDEALANFEKAWGDFWGGTGLISPVEDFLDSIQETLRLFGIGGPGFEDILGVWGENAPTGPSRLEEFIALIDRILTMRVPNIVYNVERMATAIGELFGGEGGMFIANQIAGIVERILILVEWATFLGSEIAVTALGAKLLIQDLSDSFENLRLVIGKVGAFVIEKLVEYLGPGGKAWVAIGRGIDSGIQIAREKLSEWGRMAVERWEQIKLDAGAKWEEVRDSIITTIGTMINNVLFSLEVLRWRIVIKWLKFKSDAREAWDTIKEKIGSAIDSVKEFIDGLGRKLSSFKTTYLNPIISRFNSLRSTLERVKTWIDKVAGALSGINMGKIQQIINRNLPQFGQYGGRFEKDQPVIVGERGWEMFVPRVSGMIYNQQQLVRMFASLQRREPAPVSLSHGAMGGQVINVNFGGVAIYDQMSLAEFDARVKQVMVNELR